MKKNKIIFFLSCFAVSFFMIYAITFRQHVRQAEILTNEASVIHEEVLHRFELFMDSLISRGIVTSEYFSQGTLYTKNYEQLASSLIANYDEILGINIVDQKGQIIRVFPYEDNKMVLGKKSQNFEFMMKSFEAGDEFWISSPFKLYQGPQGFVVYVPIKRDQELMGWIAPVISNERFFKKFVTANFMQSYGLVIRDAATGLSYFATGNPEEIKTPIRRQSVNIRGRELIFLSWQKKPSTDNYLWPLSIFMALIISFIMTYLYGLFEQKLHSNMHPDEVDNLLRVSIQDASSGMVLIQNQLELMKLGASHISPKRISLHAMYISNLLEQIKILQRISNQDESTKLHKTLLLPLLTEVTDYFNETVENKKIALVLNSEDLAKVSFFAHSTLFKNSVLLNLFNHIIQNTSPGTTIQINNTQNKYHHQISITVIDLLASSDFREKMKSDRSLTGARRVLELHQGELLIENNTQGHLIFLILLPLIR